MARTRLAPLPLPKRPARFSLRHIGIPDSTDVLAVYLWWLKQRRFREHVALRPASSEEQGEEEDLASSVRSVVGADEDERESLEPVPADAQPCFEWREVGFDLRGVGGQFD